ncbi:hypothetical protein MCC02031_17810 [Bifidobacteriaceae bacterium MCC02031]|nr:hypothetical protein MCC02031_17810 [Bifidobacteriaceae bacterium MCC02031]
MLEPCIIIRDLPAASIPIGASTIDDPKLEWRFLRAAKSHGLTPSVVWLDPENLRRAKESFGGALLAHPLELLGRPSP